MEYAAARTSNTLVEAWEATEIKPGRVPPASWFTWQEPKWLEALFMLNGRMEVVA